MKIKSCISFIFLVAIVLQGTVYGAEQQKAHMVSDTFSVQLLSLSEVIVVGVYREKHLNPDMIQIRSLKNGALLKKVPTSHNFAVSHDERYIAYWLYCHDRVFSNYLIVSDLDKLLKNQSNHILWEKQIYENERYSQVYFSSKDNRVITVQLGRVDFWDTQTGKNAKTLTKMYSGYDTWINKGRVVYSELSPDGRYIAVWSEMAVGDSIFKLTALFRKRKITVWDLVENKRVGSWSRPSGLSSRIYNVSFSNNALLAMRSETDVDLVSLSSGETMWREHTPLHGLQLSIAGNIIVLLQGDDKGKPATLRFLKIPEFDVMEEIEFGKTFASNVPLNFSPDGRFFVFEDSKYIFHLYDTISWEEIWNVRLLGEE